MKFKNAWKFIAFYLKNYLPGNSKPLENLLHTMATTVIRRNPTRTRAAPERFQNLTFVKGSGEVGCDQYDRGYDRGHFYGNLTDLRQKQADTNYTAELEEALKVETVTQKLPVELGEEIKKLVSRPAVYKSDIDFIAPDDVEPQKEIEKDEEGEWESGEETEEDEEELDLEDDE